MSSSSPSVTTVVVTYNSAHLVEDCIGAIKKFMPYARRVVVDNDSSDVTRARVKDVDPDSIVIALQSNKGFGTANNIAMRRFESDYYLLVNPDAFLCHDVFAEMISLHPEPTQIGLATPTLQYLDGSFQSSFYSFTTPTKMLLHDLGAARIMKWLDQRPEINRKFYAVLSCIPILRTYLRSRRPISRRDQEPIDVDWITGACMLVSSHAFQTLKGFDENIFLYGEDEELCFRAKSAGINVQWLPSKPVLHICGYQKNKGPSKHSAIMEKSVRYYLSKMYQRRPFQRFLLKLALDLRFRSV